MSAQAWQATPDDALLLETRIGAYQVGDGVRGYATPGPGVGTDAGACLIFADVAVTLDLAIAADRQAGTLRGWAFAEDNRIAVDRRGGKLSLRGQASALPPASIRDTPEGWCIDTAALSAWLGVQLVVDGANALLFVKSSTKLPVERAQERRARAASIRPAAAVVDPARLPRIELPYLLWRTPALDAVLTVNGVRDARTGSRGGVRYELFASGEALRMSVDARLSSDDRGVPQTLRARAFRTDPDAGLLGPLRATHVAIGDVGGFSSPLVGQSSGGRGALVTNRPLDRADGFDRTSFRGELPDDWDAELYRNGQLLGFAQNRSDGRYEFLDVPLLFGTNRFEIVSYGPQGQVRRRAELLTVGADSIPAGKTYYWAGASQDDRDLVRLGHDPPDASARGWRGTFGVERGLDPLTSVSAQLHTLVLQGERLTFVEGAVRRGVGPALVELSLAYERHGGIAARAQMIGQLGDTYISAELVSAMRGFRSDRIDANAIRRHTLAIDHSFLLARTMFPTHLEARYVERRDAPSTLEAAARVSANLRDIAVTAGLDWQVQRMPDFQRRSRDPPEVSTGAAARDQIAAAVLVNGRLRGVGMRGEARYRLSGERSGFEGATLVGEWGASDRAQWRAEVGYDAPTRRARGAIGYSRRFDRFAIGAKGEAASDGSVAAGLNLAFSVGPRSGGGLRVTASRLGSSGTAVARVFRDLNDDGVRQSGEPYERGVQLTAGTSVAGTATDALGRSTIDDLAPFRGIAIGVDSSTLVDPQIGPKVPGRRVVPRPGLTFAVDIPLVATGEVEGTLVRESITNEGSGIEGVDLELIDARGAVARTQRTDFDGYFLFEGVAYGEYALRIAALSAGAARLLSDLSVTAKVGGASPSVRLGSVVARTAAPVAIAGAD